MASYLSEAFCPKRVGVSPQTRGRFAQITVKTPTLSLCIFHCVSFISMAMAFTCMSNKI